MTPQTARILCAMITFGAAATYGCEKGPTAPRCGGVEVSSPIGPRLGRTRTTQLAASVLSASNPPSAGFTFTWQSSAPAIAIVGTSGLVTGVATGSATITATALECDVSGTLVEQVIDADFATAHGILTDLFASALQNGMTATLRGQMQQAVTQCLTGMNSGNFDTLQVCIANARRGIAAATDSTDKALGATFGLFVDQTSRLLRLQ